MKNAKKSFAAHLGFTLVEMLVVIGIIGILAGVLIGAFGGSTEAARAAKCTSNLRSLAMAVNARAMHVGRYPLAGSREVLGINEDASLSYRPQYGWISWLDEGNYDDGHGNKVATSHRNNQIAPFFGTGDEDESLYALTNGTIWTSCARNRDLYVCPTHRHYRGERNYAAPLWSYVMNARFGWDTTKGSDAVGADLVEGVVEFGKLARADRILLFAELPTVDPETGADLGEGSKGLASDCVLQYLEIQPSSGGGKGPYASPSGDAESIGFVHKANKGRYCAHIVYADGHTEKILWNGGGSDTKKLTAYLCRGWDVTFSDQSGWQLAPDGDKMGD